MDCFSSALLPTNTYPQHYAVPHLLFYTPECSPFNKQPYLHRYCILLARRAYCSTYQDQTHLRSNLAQRICGRQLMNTINCWKLMPACAVQFCFLDPHLLELPEGQPFYRPHDNRQYSTPPLHPWMHVSRTPNVDEK